MKVYLTVGTSLALLAALVVLPGCGKKENKKESMADLLDGQEATHARTVETETGGDPHHKPIQYRDKDSRPAITEPEFVPASNARISAGTKGIGVNIDGKSRFYPLYVLQYHQIINDKVGNRAIACSY
jgi:hypothetical protein